MGSDTRRSWGPLARSTVGCVRAILIVLLVVLVVVLLLPIGMAGMEPCPACAPAGKGAWGACLAVLALLTLVPPAALERIRAPSSSPHPLLIASRAEKPPRAS